MTPPTNNAYSPGHNMYEQNAVSSTLEASSQQPQEILTNTLTTLQSQATSSHQVIQQSAVHEQINDISSLVNGIDVQIQPTIIMDQLHSFRPSGMLNPPVYTELL